MGQGFSAFTHVASSYSILKSCARQPLYCAAPATELLVDWGALMAKPGLDSLSQSWPIALPAAFLALCCFLAPWFPMPQYTREHCTENYELTLTPSGNVLQTVETNILCMSMTPVANSMWQTPYIFVSMQELCVS